MKAGAPLVSLLLLLGVAVACLVWGLRSTPAGAGCDLVQVLLRIEPQCRWPAPAHFGLKLALAGALACLLWMRLRRRSESQR